MLDSGVRYVLEKAGTLEFASLLAQHAVDVSSLVLLSDEDFEKVAPAATSLLAMMCCVRSVFLWVRGARSDRFCNCCRL